MSISGAVSASIHKYGSIVTIAENEDVRETRAFIEPLRLRSRVLVGDEYLETGVSRRGRYLYIGPPEYTLSEKHSIVIYNGQSYRVTRSEVYYIESKAAYVWAVLALDGEEAEDEYDGSQSGT